MNRKAFWRGPRSLHYALFASITNRPGAQKHRSSASSSCGREPQKEMMNDECRMMNEQKSILERTKEFALRIIRLYYKPPRSTEAQVIGKQLLRSGTSERNDE